ncbi:hypothetical protein N9948_01325, partial [bacterium]|nr:hypothetical protein [bacterium]
GLDSDGAVTAVYVDREHRDGGIAEKLHKDVFKANPRVISGDRASMWPEEIDLWEKFLVEMPNYVRKLKDGTYVYEA